MKIWLVQRAEPTPHDDGGAHGLMRVGNLGMMMAERGHSVVWWTSTFDHLHGRQRFDRDTRLFVRPGFDIEYVRGPGYRRKRSIARIMADQRLAHRFAIRIRNSPERPDLILASLPDPHMALHAVRFGRRNGVPVVVDVRDLWPDVLQEHVPTLLRAAGRVALAPMAHATMRALADADAVTGVTEAYVNWGLHKGRRQRTPRDRAFPLGYVPGLESDAERAESEVFWDRLDIRPASGRLIVAFVGVLGHWADFTPVIAATEALRAQGLDVHLVICGDGDARADLEVRTRDVPSITMPGWVTKSQIRTLLQRADVGLAAWVDHPNFRNNIGNKVAEYLSAGVPIALSLPEGVLKDVVTERGCGFSYAGSADKLADALAEMLMRPAVRDAYRQGARVTFREMFDGSVIYDEMISHMEMIATCFRTSHQDLLS